VRFENWLSQRKNRRRCACRFISLWFPSSFGRKQAGMETLLVFADFSVSAMLWCSARLEAKAALLGCERRCALGQLQVRTEAALFAIGR